MVFGQKIGAFTLRLLSAKAEKAWEMILSGYALDLYVSMKGHTFNDSYLSHVAFERICPFVVRL